MLIYPNGETKTDYKSPPWATLIIICTSAIAFGWVTHHLNQANEERRSRAKLDLLKTVEQQYQAGQLDKNHWIRFQENNRVIEDPQLASAFSEGARRYWLNASDSTPPLVQIVNKPPRNLLLSLTAHHLAVLLMGVFCLGFVGYLLEHQYDPQVILALFVSSGCCWVLLGRVLPESMTPSPVFAWANTVMVVLLVGVITAPKAQINVAVRLWLGKAFGGDVEVPALTFPALFIATYVGVTALASPYASWFQPMPLAVVVGQAIVFSLLLIFVPGKGPLHTVTPEQQIELDLAKAKVCFDSKREEEGLSLLRAIAISEPSRKHLRAVADLAWRNDEKELSDQCYRTLLRKTSTREEEVAFLDIVNEMLFRRISLSANYLLRAMALSLKAGHMGQIRKLLPFIVDNKDINSQEVGTQLESLVDKILAQKEPDRRLLLQVQGWLEAHNPESEHLEMIKKLFQSGAQESSLTGHFTPVHRVHRAVDVDLLNVSSDRVVIQVRGQKEQRIPWTAFAGIFGCHVSGANRGFRGCLVVRFKRKLFCCTFTTAQILIRENDGPMTFEKAWALLKSHVPEDLPMLTMKDFQTVKDDSGLVDMVEEFINQDCEVSPT